MESAQSDLGSLVWNTAEQRAAQGDASYVGELGSRLIDQHAAAVEQVQAFEHSLAHVARALALTPGRDNVTQLLQLLN